MPTLAIAPRPTAQPPSINGFPVPRAVTLVFFVALWLFLCRHLSGEWSVNEQYNYGWFVPFFAILLFWLRLEDRAKLQIKGQKSELRAQSATFRISDFGFQILAAAAAVCCLLLLLPLRLFEIGNPDWRPLGWLHAAVTVILTLLFIWYAAGPSWLRHFAFPVAFIFVAVPWVTPIEAPVIQGLMRGIAAAVSETLNLFGIPTQLEGNLIRVGNGLVGVNEACSGVRSLQTSLMIGLLFGEVKRLSIWRRAALVIGAIAIALAANFCRAFFLIWIAATKSISATERWHDFAGYSIVAAVFIGSLALASLLGRTKAGDQIGRGTDSPWRKSEIRSAAGRIRRGESQRAASFLAAAGLGWLILVELAAVSWYRLHERNLIETERWSVRWPASAPGFHLLKLDEQVRSTLRFDYGEAASWDYRANNSTIVSPSGVAALPRATWFVYFFRWEPGRNSALLANLHRPDVCLPAIGWKQVADDGVRQYPTGNRGSDLYLPFRHFEFRVGTKVQPQQAAHAFYCLWEDRASGAATASPSRLRPGMATFPSSWTRGERVRTVLEGRRHLGQQVMEVVLATHGQIDSKEAQADFAALLPKLIVPTPQPKQQ